MQNIENEAINDRLKQYYDQKNLTIWEVEKSANLTRGVLFNALKNKKGVGIDKIAKIITAFPDLNSTWLLTGEGEMIVGKQEADNPKYEIKPLEKQLGIPIEKQFIVPIIGSAQAGYIVGYGDEDLHGYYEMMHTAYHLDRNVRGFVVHGDSMVHQLMHDDIVLCQRVIDIRHHFFKPASIYVLVCVDGIVVKHLAKLESGFRVRSANPTYTSYMIDFGDVIEIWKAEVMMKKLH